MKIWTFIFLFGLAIATPFQDAWEGERDKTLFELMKGMKTAGPLRVAMGMPEAYELDEVEDDIKTELGKALREGLDRIMQRIKDAVDEGKEVHKDLTEKMAKMILEQLKDGEGRKVIIDLVDELINRKEKESRSLKETWDELKHRLKDFFKEKHMKFKERFSAFFEWLKYSIENGLEIAKDKTQALKNIAREIIKYSREISKEVAIEALEALKPYKGDLGGVWDELKAIVIEILHRKD